MPLTSPRQKTIKRLFGVSGNQCYFPNCNTPLVDEKSGKVTGKISHIKGRKPGAARYDPNQTDEERHSFDNLILMCPIHNAVIDDDSISYTIFKLKEIKIEHEKIHAGGVEPSKKVAKQFVLNLTKGSIISTKNQKGGQVAQSIININYQDRVDLEKNQDTKIIKFFATCLDRPAFQDPFDREYSYRDFDKAIEDTITAFNTGTLYSRDGRKLALSKGKSYLSNTDLKENIDKIVEILRDIRDRFYEENKNEKRYIFQTKPELMKWFDSKRENILNIFDDVCKQIGVNWRPNFPRERFSL